jgi:DNA-binding transcriptional ArsR family regulator
MKPIFSKEIRQLAEHQAMLGKVFSNPNRVLILWLLMDTEKTVSEIARAIGASKPRTSQHLLLMKHGNILESHREQRNIYYRIVDMSILQDYPILTKRPNDQYTD